MKNTSEILHMLTEAYGNAAMSRKNTVDSDHKFLKKTFDRRVATRHGVSYIIKMQRDS